MAWRADVHVIRYHDSSFALSAAAGLWARMMAEEGGRGL